MLPSTDRSLPAALRQVKLDGRAKYGNLAHIFSPPGISQMHAMLIRLSPSQSSPHVSSVCATPTELLRRTRYCVHLMNTCHNTVILNSHRLPTSFAIRDTVH